MNYARGIINQGSTAEGSIELYSAQIIKQYPWDILGLDSQALIDDGPVGIFFVPIAFK